MGRELLARGARPPPAARFAVARKPAPRLLGVAHPGRALPRPAQPRLTPDRAPSWSKGCGRAAAAPSGAGKARHGSELRTPSSTRVRRRRGSRALPGAVALSPWNPESALRVCRPPVAGGRTGRWRLCAPTFSGRPQARLPQLASRPVTRQPPAPRFFRPLKGRTGL